MTVGERIRYRRKELDMTQEQLAKAIGCSSKTSISNIENRMTSPKPDMVMKIADALLTSAAWLYGWTDDHPNIEAFIEPTISEEEMKIIEAFRAKTYSEKLAFKTLLGIQEDEDHDD